MKNSQFLYLSDAELIAKYSEQNEESADALEAIVEHHSRVARRIVNFKLTDEQDRKEAIAAAWHKVMEKSLNGEYKEMGCFPGWFIKILYNEATTILRRRSQFIGGEEQVHIIA